MISLQWIDLRRLVTLGTVAGLVVAAAPPAAARAPDAAGPAAPYVVLMKADPVVASADSAATELDPTAPEVTGQVRQREQAQDGALAAADLPASAKLGSFTFAVNGFSAALTPEQAAPGREGARGGAGAPRPAPPGAHRRLTTLPGAGRQPGGVGVRLHR